MADVVAIGELLIDFACIGADDDGYPTLQAHAGGAPANYLATLSKLNTSCALITKVGNDAFGKLLINTLNDLDISTKGVAIDDSVFTTLAFVTFDENGDREFSFSRKPGADTKLTQDEIDLSLINDAKVLHFGTLSLTDEPSRSATKFAVDYAKNNNKLITFDPNLRKPLWNSLTDAKKEILWGFSMADVIKCSDDEIEFLWGISPLEGAQKIIDNYNCKLVFITCGKNGCYVANKNDCVFVDSFNSLKTIDTTGAGDIFFGSAVWKMLKYNKSPNELSKDELYSLARFACASAGLSTTKQGGISSIPDYDSIENLLNNF
jgi:sugar/nucleoside kinase (ribokinase family)